MRVALLLAVCTSVGALEIPDRAQRTAVARAEFQRVHPCPANGKRRGPCPGWQVDHRQALVCGGLDEPANMQWLTVADHRRKTRDDVRACRRRGARQS